MEREMTQTVFYCSLLIAPGLLAQPQAAATGHAPGKFIGNLILIPLPDGRNMKLQEPFSYVDAEGHQLDAPAGFVSDGASIPRLAWTLVGGPWDGNYRNAAVVHDVGCVTHKYPSNVTHRIFYDAMLDSGVGKTLALTMYYAVVVGGPSWINVETVEAKDQGTLTHKVEVATGRKASEVLHYRDPAELATGVEFVVKRTESGAGANKTYRAEVVARPSELAVGMLPALTLEELQSRQKEIEDEEAKGHTVTPEEVYSKAMKVVAASSSKSAKAGFTQVFR
jgi:hypothetical protein